jgi:ElaB/YqjD/DUF883 family membrane-anchored ribosome-binding protein
MTATPPTKTPEEIEREMLHTRESLTEKVAALENQVVGSVQTAADTLTGTVESVKSLITTAPGAVSDTVKEAATVVSEKMKEVFDISGHVREHPWSSVGVSALLGCVTGWLLSRRQSLGYSEAVAPPSSMGLPTATKLAGSESAAKSGPGVFDELFSMLGHKVREIAENAIDSAAAAVNQNVRDGVPKLVDAAAERLTPEESFGNRFAERRR